MSIDDLAKSADEPGEQDGAKPAMGWLALAIGSLVLAGSFALFLVIGRVPPFSGWLGDPEFFKRCLVVHVDLSIVVWFHAFTAGLFGLLPSQRTGPARRVGLAISLFGVGTLLACIFLKSAKPILSNYVPSLDHPLFLVGIGAFFLGVAVSFFDGRLLPGCESPKVRSALPLEARPGARAAALAFIFAVLTFVASAVALPEGLLPETRNELLFWGGGHVLQISSVASMLTVWLMLLTPALGQAPISRRVSAGLFGLLLLPAAFAPVLALAGPATVEVHDGFTRLMELGIFPAVTVFAVLCLRAVVKAVRERGVRPFSPGLLTFYASAALTTVGFCLGGLIRGNNTVVPAHYHASIGAVTASLMGVTYLIFAFRGLPQPSDRLVRASRWQPVLFGLGQAVFAAGFALAGSQGMARKTYATEQHIRTGVEIVGLSVMGAGGLVAVAGGLLFIAWVLKARWTTRTEGRSAWQPRPQSQPVSIPFKP